ncbi:MAG TPA: lipid-A-disaccharide synthase [Pseudomonadales bacterium]
MPEKKAIKTPVFAMVAGEMSGDLLGAGLIRELKKAYPNAHFVGIGGKKMQAEGFESLFPMERLAVMGIVDVLGSLFELLKIRRQLKQYFLDNKPDVFIGIDAPDFNLDLEAKLKTAGIKTVHYVSPSVWAWRQGRIKKIAVSVDLMLTLLPFEAKFYQDHGVPVQFVGHPLADQIPIEVDQTKARQQLGYQNDDRLIAILPGSRRGELKFLGPVFCDTLSALMSKDPTLNFVIPAANDKRKQEIESLLDERNLPYGKSDPLNKIKVIPGQAQTAMAAADAVLLASGTATLEAMLLKKPMVVAYKWSRFTHAIISRMVKTPFVSLPNLLANKMLVEELIQEKANVASLLPALENVLNNEKNKLIKEEFTRLHQSIRCGGDEKAAAAVNALLINQAIKI